MSTDLVSKINLYFQYQNLLKIIEKMSTGLLIDTLLISEVEVYDSWVILQLNYTY